MYSLNFLNRYTKTGAYYDGVPSAPKKDKKLSLADRPEDDFVERFVKHNNRGVSPEKKASSSVADNLSNNLGENSMFSVLNSVVRRASETATSLLGSPNDAHEHQPLAANGEPDEYENISTAEFLLGMVRNLGEVFRREAREEIIPFSKEDVAFAEKKKNIFFTMIDNQLKKLGITISEEEVDHPSLSAYLIYRCGNPNVQAYSHAQLATAVLNAAYIFLQAKPELEITILYQIKEAFTFTQYDDVLQEQIGFNDVESDNDADTASRRSSIDRGSMKIASMSGRVSFRMPKDKVRHEESEQYAFNLLAAFYDMSSVDDAEAEPQQKEKVDNNIVFPVEESSAASLSIASIPPSSVPNNDSADSDGLHTGHSAFRSVASAIDPFSPGGNVEEKPEVILNGQVLPVAQARVIYSVPRSGNCCYSSILVALMHGFLSNEMTEASQAAGVMSREYGLLKKIENKLKEIDPSFEYTGDTEDTVKEKFRQLLSLSIPRINACVLLEEVMVPALRETIFNYVDSRLEGEADELCFKCFEGRSDVHKAQFRTYFASVTEAKRYGGPADIAVVNQMYGISLKENAVADFSPGTDGPELLPLIIEHMRPIDGSDHYQVVLPQGSTINAEVDTFVTEVNAIFSSRGEEKERASEVAAISFVHEDEQARRQLEKQKKLEEQLRLQAALENARRQAEIQSAITSETRQIVREIIQARTILSDFDVTETQARNALIVLLRHKHDIDMTEAAAIDSVGRFFENLREICGLLLEIHAFQNSVFGGLDEEITDEAKYIIINAGWRDLLNQSGGTVEQQEDAKFLQQEIMKMLPKKQEKASPPILSSTSKKPTDTNTKKTPPRRTNRRLSFGEDSSEKTTETPMRTPELMLLRLMTSLSTCEKKDFIDAMVDYYRFENPNKASALQVLIKMVLDLSHPALGLNVHAPAAITALEEQLAIQPTSMDAVYPHLYTVLQAVLATEKDNSVDPRNANQVKAARKAIVTAKSILKWLADAPSTFPALEGVHARMVRNLYNSTNVSVEQALAQLDESECVDYDREHIRRASPKAADILRHLPFIWSGLYRKGANEQDDYILEQRRKLEAMSVAALKKIMLDCTGGESLTLEQQWLLVTAITDYDDASDYLEKHPRARVRAISPFYNAIKLLVTERDIAGKELRDQLCNHFLSDYFSSNNEATTTLSMVQKNLQEKIERRAHSLLERASKIRHSMSGSMDLSAGTPSRRDSTSRQENGSIISTGGQSVASDSTVSSSVPTSTHALSASWDNLETQYSSINRSLNENEIIKIFKLFDAKCHVTAASERNNLMLLLTRAFEDMEKLFKTKDYNRNTYMFYASADGVAPYHFDDFMKHIAPKAEFPAYIFAQFCAFQANKGTKLYKYEDKFIRTYLHRLYDHRDRGALNTMSYKEKPLGDYVAPPLQEHFYESAIKKTAIGLIYPRLNIELKALEDKLNRGTLTKKDVDPYETLACAKVSELVNNHTVAQRLNILINALQRNTLHKLPNAGRK